MPGLASFLARRAGGRAAARALPWARFYEVAMFVYRRGRRGWERLSGYEREEFVRIMRHSRGRPGSVSPRDRRELRRIVGKLLAEARRFGH